MGMMGVLDVMAPALVIIGAIALVAVLYLVITAVKDRVNRAREERAGNRGPRHKR